MSPQPDSATQTHGVSFGEALRFWCKLGFISFGGPAGQIAIMHRELVEQRRWISESRFLHALNYCMLLPGPEAQQLATYIGWLMHRTVGGVAAGVLFVLPSLALLIVLSWVYVAFGQVAWVAAFLYGVKPAVAALVFQALHRIASRTLKTPRTAPWLWALAACSFVGIYFLQVPFPAIVLAAAGAGWLMVRWAPSQFTLNPLHPSGDSTKRVDAARWLIDDTTSTPAHARFSRTRLSRVLLGGLFLWAMPMAWLVQAYGWDATLAQMGWFFTKAALLTFGGAYAVLPYVYQGAVEHYSWLTGAQMMDGLALGETTPGPLIMVVAFVGFLGGWANQVLGAQAQFLGAALAAVVVTWFTFLPSFVFILVGGPLVEATHGKLHWYAPLTAVTAAVVGVIASLGLFFLAHIAVVPDLGATHGWMHLDAFAISLAAAAWVGLVRFNIGVVPVILSCGLAGVVVRTVLL